MDHRFITTALDLPGYKITGTLGLVRGIVVRSRSAVGNFGASIQSLFGGNITILTDLCEQSPQRRLRPDGRACRRARRQRHHRRPLRRHRTDARHHRSALLRHGRHRREFAAGVMERPLVSRRPPGRSRL